MLSWLSSRLASERESIARGDVARVVGRHIPMAGFFGAVLGGALVYLSLLPALLLFAAFGFAAGYAARSYVSHRRREAMRRQRGW
jgi:uncharacterized membrane protein SpoIIM required for sporulation